MCLPEVRLILSSCGFEDIGWFSERSRTITRSNDAFVSSIFLSFFFICFSVGGTV